MAATHWSDARAELKRMRETQERSPSKVLRLAVPLLDTHSHRLGDEGACQHAVLSHPQLTTPSRNPHVHLAIVSDHCSRSKQHEWQVHT